MGVSTENKRRSKAVIPEDNPQTLRGKRLHNDIARRVVKQFAAGFYEEAAFNAFKVVDQRLRSITGEEDALPLELVNKAFNPSTGSLRDTRGWQSEREGIYLLMRGAFLSYRNPPAHRFMDIDEETAFDLIILANHMYSVIEEAYQRTKAQPSNAPTIQYQSTSYEKPTIFQLDTDNDGELETIVPQYAYGGLVEIFKDSPSGPVAAEVEKLGRVPGEGLDSVALADVDNDGRNELICVIGYATGTALLCMKYHNGRYEVLRRAPAEQGRDLLSLALFSDAQISDIDSDGEWEIVSEPFGSIPDDLWPAGQPHDGRDMGYVRYVYKWNNPLNGFELIERKLLRIGGR
jgi:uncharacterized protein (TIGR02391 family)